MPDTQQVLDIVGLLMIKLMNENSKTMKEAVSLAKVTGCFHDGRL